jgi:hypothetical protein
VSWQLQVPYWSREDTLAEVAIAAGDLDNEARATVLAVIERTLLDTNVKTAGALIDSIERLDRAGAARR